VVLVDDIIDTAGTITKAANLMMENGANSVRAMCTHPVFSEGAFEKINESALTEVIVTDTIKRESSGKITVLSTAEIFADVIKRVNKNKSISTHFEFTTML
jgi:ribose-phosphate pyrophosphokinase